MKKDLKIVISGGGVAGLLLALSLHNLNLDPVVYEQAPTLISEAGGAVGMYPNGLSVIRDISPALLKEIRSFGQPYKLRKWYRHTGQVIATASEDKLREFNKIDLQELASIGIRRYRLQQCLVTACENAGIKIIYGNRINSVSICANKTVDCTLSDKTIVNCDLLFGCDGVKSAIRSSLFGQESDPEYTGVTSPTASTSPINGICFPASPQTNMHGCFYPIKDSIIFQIFYKAPLKPETWKPLSEEEGKLECTQLATQLKKDGWDKQFTNVIETSTNVLRTGLRARSPIKTWHAPLDHPRVVLLGDAAHPPVPYIGQGAMMAVEDVGVLTLLLKNFCIQSDGFDMNGMSKVVEYYERIRYPRTKMMLENSMRLGDMQMKRGSDLVTRFVNELKIKSEVLRFGTLRTMWSGSRYEYQTEVSKMLAEFKELKASEKAVSLFNLEKLVTIELSIPKQKLPSPKRLVKKPISNPITKTQSTLPTDLQSYEFSDSFLEHLNSNARVIQKWYRQLQANKKKSVDSIINEFASKRKPVRVKKVSKTGNQSKVLNDLKEDPIMKRRRERAESVRLEILKDIEASSSTLTLNNVDAPITDIESSSLKLDILESPVMDRESSTFTLNVIESPTLDRESSTLTLNEITSNCEIKVLKDNRNAYLTSNINASNDSEIESDIINSIDKKRVVDQTAQKNIALELNEETNFIKVDTIDDSINCDSIDENQISVEPQIEYIETRNVEIDHRKDENVSTREEIISIESQSPKVEISTPPPSRNDLKRSNTKKSSSSKSSSKNCIKKYETAPSIYSTNKTEDSNDTTSQSVDRILGFLKNVQVETPNVPKPEIVTEGFSSNVFDGVKQKIIGLQLEIEEKNHIIAAYKQEAKKLKDENKEQAIQSKNELKSKISLQRKEYESIIKRHLGFIEKSLAEKDDLTKKCESLSDQVKNMEKAFKDRCVMMEEQSIKEMKQQKELWSTTEKVKREKWITEKTKIIKDQTIKGLEPEIQRMLAQHKIQLRQVEERLREEASKERQVAAEQTQQQLSNLRDRIVAERQKACEEEREFARQRYQKQLERDELEFQQIKRKMMADFNEQVHNLTESAKQDRNSDESRFKTTIEKLRKETEIIQAENLQNIASIRQKQVEEVAKLQESHNLQLQQFQTQFTANQEAIMLSREKKFKEKLIKERDMEIELIINRLESETNSSDSDIQRRHRMEVEKLKSEFANSVCELRDQHSQALDKIVLMQSNLSVAETRFHDLQKQVVGLQIEKQSKENIIMQQRDRIERLNVDEAALSAIIKEEFEEVSVSQVKEIQELNVKIETIQSQTQILIRKHEREIHEMTKQKEDTLTMVEEHVKMTLKIKDEAIFALKKQIEELSIKNLHLEKLIDRQRQEILTLG